MNDHSAGALRSRLAELDREMQGLLQAHEEASRASELRKAEEDSAVKEGDARAKAGLQDRLQQLAEQSVRDRQAIEEGLSRDLARIDKAFANACARAERRSSQESVRLDQDRRRVAEKAVHDLKTNCAPILVESAAELAELRGLQEDVRRAKDRIAALAKELKIRPADLPGAAEPPKTDPARISETVRKSLEELEPRLAAAQKASRGFFARCRPRFLPLAGLILLAHAGALLALRQYQPARFMEALWVAPFTFVGLIIVTSSLCGWAARRVHALADPLQETVLGLLALLQRREAFLRSREKTVKKGFLQRKSDFMAEMDERYRSLESQGKTVANTRQEILQEQRDALGEKARQRKDQRLAREAGRLEAEKRAAEERLKKETELRRQVHAETLKDIAARGRAGTERLAGRWAQAIEEFRRRAEEACRSSRELHPSWDDPRWKDFRMPREFPGGVRLGEVRFDVNALVAHVEGGLPFAWKGTGEIALPLDLSFPGKGNLFIGSEPEDRRRSLQGLLNTVLRVLCSFPPGKAKFTLFDPVGLGENFSALMHLADFEESLVGGRIWTETVHIERKLAELTEHIEKVIQKYLRNRYHSIGEYNREVAQMAEAFRFVVVADFPTGFSELALERLASIVTSGPRCGVHVLILRDRRQKMPPSMDPAILKGAGLLLQAVEGGFMVEEEILDRGILSFEAPPTPETLTPLLQAVGRQGADADRVELSFGIIAPGEDRLWKESSEGGVRIPLGRAGADRLQVLDLGRGTAQHALIAGKTGSGKSTLFHVMVTNAALWYSPQELELYLIDFKKGVEFKTYAVRRLPHARVIAIESDREFGLSVLRRIDGELATRAEIYRKRGVQDFAGCRRAAGAEHLPRTLLLIDEFQEFFTEEDAIAQEAALLLDRIVRQGRAFGIHVLLGSQTLGGSYTLAKTTLGQMAVRIALQCNEADSYLILNDDNAAARLLSRPGEAIYNDMSGMVEGNNPFQVAWLPDEVREQHLLRVAGKAGPDPGPLMVFEGNVPADLRNNPMLRERLANPFRADAEGGVAAWVGEANAIKGPTEVRFRNQGSSNLLIVGQHREGAQTVVSSALLSLAAAAPPERARFVILDGSPPELGLGRHFAALARTLPHEVDLVEYARVAAVMKDLGAEVAGRLEGQRKADRRVFLVVFDLQRFRQLRQKSDYDFGGSEEDKSTPDRCFAEILTEGPAQGVHALVWSDSLNNLNRTLNRKTLKEFQMRVLFQMSGTDSAELIDTPMASTLGLYRALLFLEEHGTVEKFRPYALPDEETLEGIRKALGGGRP